MGPSDPEPQSPEPGSSNPEPSWSSEPRTEKENPETEPAAEMSDPDHGIRGLDSGTWNTHILDLEFSEDPKAKIQAHNAE